MSGTEPAGDSWVSQTVQVPAGGTLSFWYWPSTTDGLCSGSGCVYDWEEAQIRSTSGATLATVFKSNTNAQAWTQVSYDMSAYAGQTVVLWFNVHQDAGGDPTYMYLDDISLTGSGATAPGGADERERDGGERAGDGELDGAEQWGQRDHELYGHAVHRVDGADADHDHRVAAGDEHDGHRADQRHDVHVHGHGHQRDRDRSGVELRPTR